MKIHDPLLGMMEFTGEEEKIIRSPAFQRLFRIRQLATAFVAYPTATHTRFEHSLGVCAISKRIMKTIEKSGYQFNETDTILIPIIGLLYNITHTPFSFILQKHLNLLSCHKSKEEYTSRLEDIKLTNIIGKENTEIVQTVLTTENLTDLERPYYKQIIKDIVGANTIDYLLRDAYYIRTDRMFNIERVIEKNCIIPFTDNKKYLGIDLRNAYSVSDVLGEIYNLLFIRRLFAHTIYFYPVVLAADAMIGKAFRILIHKEKHDDDFFYDISDEQAVDYLVNHSDPVVSYIGHRVKNRQLFGQAFHLELNNINDLNHSSKIITCLRGKENIPVIENIEKYIANEAHIDYQDIAIFCQNPDVYSQDIDLLFIRDYPVKLFDAVHIPEVADIRKILKRHERLWSAYVFCGIREEKMLTKIAAICQELFSNMSLLEEVAHSNNNRQNACHYSGHQIIAKEKIISNWPEDYQSAYLNLIENHDWRDCERYIGKEAAKTLDHYEKNQINRSLGLVYKRCKNGEVLMDNILTARRIVLASLKKYRGNFYMVQKLFHYGYNNKGLYMYEEHRACPNCFCKNDYYSTRCVKCGATYEKNPIKKEHLTISDDGFKKFFFNTLKLKMNSWMGYDLLSEEKKWIETIDDARYN